MHNKSVDSLQRHISYFRSLMVERSSREAKPEEEYSAFIKRTLKLNKPEDWKFICSAMDLIEDTCSAIDHFLRFGLNGSSRYDEIGEKYLRLYGVLNSTYLQQEATYVICKCCQVDQLKQFKEAIESLEIRDVRHKLGAHSVDYISKHSQESLSFVPVQILLSGMSCTYMNNNTFEQTTVNLQTLLEEHVRLMTKIIFSTLEKMKKTLYKTDKLKLAEVETYLEALSVLENGGVVHWEYNEPKIVIRPFVEEI